MITNVTANTNYNNYNLGFKGLKDKLASIITDKCTTKVVSPFSNEEKQKFAQMHSLRHVLISQAMANYAFAPKITKEGMEQTKNFINFLTLPDRLRGLLNKFGYGAKFEELRSKLTFADNKESNAIKDEMRNIINECASKNPTFDKLVKSLENIEYSNEAQRLLGNSSKFDVLDLFIWK